MSGKRIEDDLIGIEVRHQARCPNSRERKIKQCSKCVLAFRGIVWNPDHEWKDSAGKRRRGKDLKGEWTNFLYEARAFRHANQTKKEKGRLVHPSDAVVKDLVQVFVADMKSGRALTRFDRPYKPRTIRGYEHVFTKYILPEWGERKLSAIRFRELRDWFADLRFEGLGASGLHNIASAFSCVYKRALEDDIAEANLILMVKLPPEETGPVDPATIVSYEEAERRLAVLEPQDAIVWATLFFAGVRIGEARALLRGNVRLTDNVIHVEAGYDDVEGRTSTKTRAGVREALLISPLRSRLRDHLLATPGSDEDPLFPSQRAGETFDPGKLRTRTYKAWEDAGFAKLNPHRARHTYASWLIAAGVPLPEAARYLGHANSKITEKVYFHLINGHVDRNLERVEIFLGVRGGEPQPVEAGTVVALR